MRCRKQKKSHFCNDTYVADISHILQRKLRCRKYLQWTCTNSNALQTYLQRTFTNSNFVADIICNVNCVADNICNERAQTVIALQTFLNFFKKQQAYRPIPNTIST